MQRNFRLFAFSIFLVSSVSCSYDNLDEYYSDVICDTVNVSFSETVFPIVERNCLGCHFDGNQTGVELTTFKKIKDVVDEGSFLGSIQHAPGFKPMPPNNKLDDCSISKIENWINDGTLNN
jgi:hypothetical protein